MRSILIGVVLMALCGSAIADDRASKIKALMEAQGLLQTFDEARSRSRELCRTQAKQMMDQAMTEFTETPELKKQITQAAEEFIQAVQPKWTPQDIVDEWAAVYGAKFTDDELDQLLAYYTSPLGKKDTQASRTSLPELSKHFADLAKPVMEKATKQYVARLKEIIKNCNCKKAPEKQRA